MPNNGSVHSIHIAAVASEPTVSVEEVRAVAGQGLEGDRYFSGNGYYSKTPGTGRQVTLIELEAIEALERDYKMKIEPGQARRNIVTRGVALNHLVGREFSVGEVRLRGMRLQRALQPPDEPDRREGEAGAGPPRRSPRRHRQRRRHPRGGRDTGGVAGSGAAAAFGP